MDEFRKFHLTDELPLSTMATNHLMSRLTVPFALFALSLVLPSGAASAFAFGPGPCPGLQTNDPAIKRVLDSKVFKQALAIADSSPGGGSTCRTLKSRLLDGFPTITIVKANAYEPGVEIELMYFGVVGKHVILLTPIAGKELIFGTTPAVWNKLIEKAAIPPIVDSVRAAAYATAVCPFVSRPVTSWCEEGAGAVHLSAEGNWVSEPDERANTISFATDGRLLGPDP